jgi:hypothetical protein
LISKRLRNKIIKIHKKGVVVHIMSEKFRITFEVPKTLVDYVDEVCVNKSTEIMKWNRSSYLRKLIIEDRDATMKELKESKELKWTLPKEKVKQQQNNEDNYDQYGDLLDLSGYKR